VESGTLTRKMAGVFAPISTPFADDESLDLDGLRFNLERYAQTGLLGYLALGSNGENRSLTEEEKLQVLGTIVRHRGRGQVVMAGATYDASATPGASSARPPTSGRTSAWFSRRGTSASR
jgi:4-hydroxy-2-oxoglutarate aldolase